ncbi:hypothetical protein E2542_SST20032 [Spatholobus suberectus]|nr:hypothetical protein E2542_SST20032 [Spatholobus suberectus]
MAHVLAMLVDGVGDFVKTLWALQERRWSYTFDAVASAVVSVTMTLVLCMLSIRSSHRHRRGDNCLIAKVSQRSTTLKNHLLGHIMVSRNVYPLLCPTLKCQGHALPVSPVTIAYYLG